MFFNRLNIRSHRPLTILWILRIYGPCTVEEAAAISRRHARALKVEHVVNSLCSLCQTGLAKKSGKTYDVTASGVKNLDVASLVQPNLTRPNTTSFHRDDPY